MLADQRHTGALLASLAKGFIASKGEQLEKQVAEQEEFTQLPVFVPAYQEAQVAPAHTILRLHAVAA